MVDLRKANPNRVFSPPIGQRSAVAASREIEIDADPAVVWELLTGFDRWPEWNPDITAVSTSGPPSVGATFRWGHESTLITSTIQRFESPRRIAWTSRSLGTTVLNDWHVQPRHGGTVVCEDESVDGPLARLLRRPLQRSLHRWVGNGLHHLKTEAERRTVLSTGTIRTTADSQDHESPRSPGASGGTVPITTRALTSPHSRHCADVAGATELT